MGVVVSVSPWSAWWAERLAAPPYCVTIAYTRRWLQRTPRLGRGCDEAVTRGGEDSGETGKEKTRQKGLVQSPSLGSVLWLSDLEHPHAEPPDRLVRAAETQGLRAASAGQAQTTCGGGWSGLGFQEVAAVGAVGWGWALLRFPRGSGDCGKVILLAK